MKRAIKFLVIIIAIGITTQGCCVFKGGSWKPLPCSKKEVKKTEKEEKEETKEAEEENGKG